MKITIQNCANVTVNGNHNHKNCKPVYNITTGKFYASGLDIANALNVEPGTVSAALNKKLHTVKGMRICFVRDIMEYLDEINEANRIRAEKVAAYDAMMAKQNKLAELEASVAQRTARIAHQEDQTAKERELLAADEKLLRELKEA